MRPRRVRRAAGGVRQPPGTVCCAGRGTPGSRGVACPDLRFRRGWRQRGRAVPHPSGPRPVAQAAARGVGEISTATRGGLCRPEFEGMEGAAPGGTHD
ncbi:hypothetical protein NDU88_006069 [Pleurodeles waltl]|uniref:Uncharacterized protein n=1 Tax=Pleurodeles waltl TaxID=8319 RepID=A0AAV7PKR4_PLEWA|nr:hypothetical protein NDU88_006069 [Pleurodeles waltl]